MYLLIDSGNSRLKIACHDGHDWRLRQALDNASQIPAALPADFQPQRIVIANVAGSAMSAQLEHVIRSLNAPSIEWLRGSPERCHLRSGYADPRQLGPDRWAAAIGAWQCIGSDCLVVCAGTATTVDVVRQPGIFAGGCILPGLDLMLDALSTRTAALPRAQPGLPPASLQSPPTETHAAITAGCLHAQLGAIERISAMLPTDSPILLAGGYAATLASFLGSRAQLQPWLVMDGLLAIARDYPQNAAAHS
ncbi:type III pantothenate kinase [Uliginosibacterium sp. 31-16]|uniref:type III pantothenate kinase n=1 Tax=Uliginosibacterium sp. 31-16 TaxID=3068315 RepID=UPI00273FEFCE|nr:type III pantothenate kinase [Uliginosibacterium sp. 31-16]MDP5241134.1 type III pantothenate kinase [Uliginosibacterium sp. 31-16]